MTTQHPTFFDVSKDIAQKFLHTVVVVDDQAAYSSADIPPTVVNRPNPLKPISTSQADQSTSARRRDTQHGLDAKEMVDSFAAQGLICAIMRPSNGTESTPDLAATAATRADVVVIDWQMNNNDDGATTKRIIEAILQSDEGRLRLIAIYTGDQDLERIAENIEKSLQSQGRNPVRTTEEPCTIKAKPLRIEVFAKGENTKYNLRRVSLDKLPGRLIESFAKMTEGLVSNAAVEAVSAIRANTHYLLSRLHKELSAVYIVQRALTHPQDALEYLQGLVAAELHSILSAQGVEREHDISVERWLSQDNGWRNHQIFAAFRDVLTPDIFQQIVMEGVKASKELKLSDSRREKLHSKIPEVLCGEKAQNLRDELAMLTMLKPPFRKVERTPMLTLGTIITADIVKEDGSQEFEYFVCIQPACDSVRLDRETNFPFLLLDKTSDKTDFSFVVTNDQKKPVYLKVVHKMKALRLLSFAPYPVDSGMVRAVTTDKGDIYNAVGGRVYKYVAELKEGFAQRIVHQFTSELSRIGLNEMEWLRLITAKKWKWE